MAAKTTPATLYGPPEEQDDVTAWRLKTLVDAGYDADSASRIAVRTDIDLHTACDMLANGCTLNQALRILL